MGKSAGFPTLPSDSHPRMVKAECQVSQHSSLAHSHNEYSLQEPGSLIPNVYAPSEFKGLVFSKTPGLVISRTSYYQGGPLKAPGLVFSKAPGLLISGSPSRQPHSWSASKRGLRKTQA